MATVWTMAMANLPPSALVLADLLSRDTAAARRVRAAFDRTMLWRWRTGARLPSRDSAVRLHALCRRIRPDGWTRAEADRAA